MQVLSTGKTGQEEGAPDAAELEILKAQLADARAEKHELEGELDQVRLQLKELDREAAASRHKRRRPSMLKGRTMKMQSPLGDLYVTINEDAAGKPFEVFCTVGKAGGAAMADSEAIGRLVSLSLRSGIPITAVRDQLRGISCGPGGGRGAAEGAVGAGCNRAGYREVHGREGGGAGRAADGGSRHRQGRRGRDAGAPQPVRGGSYCADAGGLSGLRGGAVGV